MDIKHYQKNILLELMNLEEFKLNDSSAEKQIIIPPKEIAKKVNIPIIGIGAGGKVDGQVLVLQDMLGMSKEFSPRFLRRYLDLDKIISDAVIKYSADVKSQDFPNSDEQY